MEWAGIVPEGPAGCPKAPGTGAGSAQEALHDRGPRLRQVGAVVTPAAQREDPPMLQPVGQQGQLARCPAVGPGTEAQVGDRVALEAVRAALKNDELMLEALQMHQDAWADAPEGRGIGAWRQ